MSEGTLTSYPKEEPLPEGPIFGSTRWGAWLLKLTRLVNRLQSGAVTLSAGTAPVILGREEVDTGYYIALSGNANETFRWSAKTKTGFTVTSSNGGSVAIVNWITSR